VAEPKRSVRVEAPRAVLETPTLCRLWGRNPSLAGFVEDEVPSMRDVEWRESGGDPRLTVHREGRVYPYFLLGMSRAEVVEILREHQVGGTGG